jgi:phospholipid/cholesterol/gamma-HCH transport system substrate-binding protein
VNRLGTVSLRRQNVLMGAIALLLLVGTTSVGVKAAFGAYAGGYRLTGQFEAAGQGLLPGSDVKVRGVKVGSVRKIELVDGQAEITIRLYDGEEIPRDAVARIRAKTLFGEKFIDFDMTGTDEENGPFYEAGDELQETEGGFELEEVLVDAYPILAAIDQGELMTVVSELAEGGRGLGEEVNRSIVNGAAVSEVFAENAALTEEFLGDLARFSGQLADSADDLLGLADAGNLALPVLNDGEAELITILQQAGRLSNDVADLLLGNKAFVDASLGDGSATLDVLYRQRNQVVPLVIGLRQYVQTLTEVVRIPVGDGTLMGAVKGILGGEICLVIPCATGPGNTTASATIDAPAPAEGAPSLGGLDPRSGDGDVSDILRRLLGR